MDNIKDMVKWDLTTQFYCAHECSYTTVGLIQFSIFVNFLSRYEIYVTLYSTKDLSSHFGACPLLMHLRSSNAASKQSYIIIKIL